MWFFRFFSLFSKRGKIESDFQAAGSEEKLHDLLSKVINKRMSLKLDLQIDPYTQVLHDNLSIFKKDARKGI